MDDPLKKRLLGAAVLAALGVLFIPMLLEPPPSVAVSVLPGIPPKPARDRFESTILRGQIPQMAPLEESAQPRPVEVVIPETKRAPPPPEVVRKAPAREAPPALESGAPESRPVAASPRSWMIQVGSFSDRAKADRLAQTLRAKNFQVPAPVPAKVGGKTLYRVRVGPLADKQRAEGLVARVGAISGTKPLVITYP